MIENQGPDYQTVKAKYKPSEMTNAKWRKLFIGIAKAKIQIGPSDWSFIDKDASTRFDGFPEERDVLGNRFENGKFQAIEYKWIRSIFIPSQPDIEKLSATIAALGDFKLESTPEGLTLLGYEPMEAA